MIRKSIVFASLVFIVGSSLASEPDATKYTPIKFTDKNRKDVDVTHKSRPVFISANKRRFCIKEENGTMTRISYNDAVEAMKQTKTPGSWASIEVMAHILDDYEKAMHKRLWELIKSKREIFAVDSDEEDQKTQK